MKGGFKMKKDSSSSVVKPRLKLIIDRIDLVRKMRGLKAPGDVLLQATLHSVHSNDCRSAKRDITMFLQIIPNVTPEERAILENSRVHLTAPYRLRIVSLTFEILNWLIMFLLMLKSKTPMGYKFSGKFSPDYTYI